MTTEPRAALDRFIAALEAHLAAVSRRQSEADPAVVAAHQILAEAFEAYDEALYDTFDEVTPFVLYDEADETDDVDDLDDDLDDLEDDLDDDDLEDVDDVEEFEDEDSDAGQPASVPRG